MRSLGAMALLVSLPALPAGAQELSEKAVRSFMEYAWSLTPARFTKPDGTVVLVDKKKKADVMVPIEFARDIIRVGRLSAHAQVCELPEAQVANYRSLMVREERAKKWSPQQMIYINQLHLTTVMLLTGKIKVVEKEGDKEVAVDETKSTTQTCTKEQREKVASLIEAYVKTGPDLASAPAVAAAQPAAAQVQPAAVSETSEKPADNTAAAKSATPEAGTAEKTAAAPEKAPAAADKPDTSGKTPAQASSKTSPKTEAKSDAKAAKPTTTSSTTKSGSGSSSGGSKSSNASDETGKSK